MKIKEHQVPVIWMLVCLLFGIMLPFMGCAASDSRRKLYEQYVESLSVSLNDQGDRLLKLEEKPEHKCECAINDSVQPYFIDPVIELPPVVDCNKIDCDQLFQIIQGLKIHRMK